MTQDIDRAVIIREIRRCAAENDGKPLGMDRFTAETGIPPYEWAKHWVRWSDAVVEAGFEPNTRQERTDDEHLLDRLAAMVRDLGRVPVEAEIRLRRRIDSTFPSHNTFRRFGNKTEVFVRLHEHASADPALADVAAICAAWLPEQRTATRPEPTGERFVTGHVYLMKSGRHHKIGHTNSVGRRAYEVSLQLPQRLELVHSIETDDPAGIEQYWHRRFADRHVNGEWFRLTPQDIAAFKRRSNFM